MPAKTVYIQYPKTSPAHRVIAKDRGPPCMTKSMANGPSAP